MKDAPVGCMVVALMLLGFVAGATFGGMFGQSFCRQDAIEAGVAEWQVDPKTGATEFVFKGAKK